MTRLTLRYAEDPATGLPRLDGRDGDVSVADLGILSREIEQHFERLASGPDGQLLTLNGLNNPGLPRHYRVTVTDRGKRCPTLRLEATDPVENGDAPATSETSSPGTLPGRWQSQFLAEAAEALAGAPSDSAARSPLDFVLADLRAVLRKDPHRFMLLLLAGYLHVGHTLSLGHGEPRDNPYSRAAEALVPHAGDTLLRGVLDPLLRQQDTSECAPAADPPEGATGWLRRFFSFS